MSLRKKIKRILDYIRTKQYVPVIVMKDHVQLFMGKVAIVTGGSGGIGSAIAEQLISQGCKVIITGTNEKKLSSVCDRLNAIHSECAKAMILNVADVQSLKEKIDKCLTLFPEGKIDILVNAAGIYSGTPFLDMTEDEYNHVMDVNLKGAYFISMHVAKHMIKGKVHGHILNVSSASALRPASNPYAVSKWGIRGLTIGLADELLPYNIVVNAIGPGPVATQMNGHAVGDSIENSTNPSHRCASTQEVADLACYLVSDRADLVVGDTFYISGGGGITSLHR